MVVPYFVVVVVYSRVVVVVRGRPEVVELVELVMLLCELDEELGGLIVVTGVVIDLEGTVVVIGITVVMGVVVVTRAAEDVDVKGTTVELGEEDEEIARH